MRSWFCRVLVAMVSLVLALFPVFVSAQAGQTDTLDAVQSRKTHGAAGVFDLPIDLNPPSGSLTIEPRMIGGGHNIVFQFSGPVTSVVGASATGLQGTNYSAVPTFAGSEVSVLVTNVPDNISVTVSVTGVNGSQNHSATVGFLVGDANGTGSVNSSDISGIKARSGQTTTAANFKFDVNASGGINASDISAGKARSGLVMPTAENFAAPTIAATAPPGGVSGDPYSFTFMATGSTPMNWSVVSGNVPAGLNLHPTSGLLTGTTTATGTYNFTVRAANGVLPNASKSVSLVIHPATVITSAAPLPATVGFSYSHTFTATGLQPITWSVTSGALPAWATLNANSGALTGTPPGVGSSSFTVTAGNALTSANRTVTLVVNTPVAPEIGAATPLTGATIGQFYSFTFTATGSTPIGWTVASGTVPGGLNLSAAGVLSGVPTTVGTHVFTVRAANGVLPDAISAAYVITVNVADVSTDGITLPNVSKIGFVTPPARDGLKGAGPEVQAYALNPARCATTPALTRSWQHNIDLADYRSKNAIDFFVMQAGQSLSYKFTVGMVDASGGFIYNDSASAVVRPTFMSVSTAPCDFNVSKLEVGPNRDSCYQTGINGNSINWANITGSLPEAYCRLVKGRTYYINLRFQDARPEAQGGSPTTDSCLSSNCGGIIQFL